MKKLLLATGIFPPDIGGPATYCKRFADEFSRKGIQVEVVTYGFPSATVPYRIFFTSRQWPSGLRQLFYAIALIRAAKGADGIISFDSLGAGLPALIVGKIRRKKVIMRLGGDFLWEKYVEKGLGTQTMREFYEKGTYKKYFGGVRRLIAFVLRRTDTIVFTTEFQRSLFIPHYRLDPDKTAVLGNVFYPEAPAVRSKNEAFFLWAGRLIRLKNIPFLLDVFQKVRMKYASTKPLLRLIGEGPEKEAIREMILQKGLEGSVKLEPALSQKELQKLIREAYCCILPSLTEISPNFALDCIAAGTPLVLTKETGIRDTFSELEYADPHNEEEFAEKIEALIGDKDHYLAYSKKVKDISYMKTWEQAADEYLKFFYA